MTKMNIKQLLGVVLLAAVSVAGVSAQGATPAPELQTPIIANEGNFITSDLTVGLVLEEAVPNGTIRVLIPTILDEENITADSGLWNGTVAQEGGFVASPEETITVTCPDNITDANGSITWDRDNAKLLGSVLYDPATNTEISKTDAQGLLDDGKPVVRYLSFVCPYSGSGKIGGQMSYDGTNSIDESRRANNNIKISGLLNPAAPAGTTVNEAIVMPGKIQLLRNTYDSTASPVPVVRQADLVSDFDVMISAILQEVVVSARVDYQIMFRIDGVPQNTETACKLPGGDLVRTTVGSSSTLVDFGAPSVNTFVDAAQRIFVDSSANNGYVITVSSNGNMARQDSLDTGNLPASSYCTGSAEGLLGDNIHRNCIPNFGWADKMLPTQSAEWTDRESNGLGYTVAYNQGDGFTPDQTGRSLAEDGQVAEMFRGSNAGYYSRFANRTLDYTADPFNSAAGPSYGAVPIASGPRVAYNHYYDVCYRLSVGAQNNAGVYDNEITYTITATL